MEQFYVIDNNTWMKVDHIPGWQPICRNCDKASGYIPTVASKAVFERGEECGRCYSCFQVEIELADSFRYYQL